MIRTFQQELPVQYMCLLQCIFEMLDLICSQEIFFSLHCQVYTAVEIIPGHFSISVHFDKMSKHVYAYLVIMTNQSINQSENLGCATI